jgi:PST family polysaccharide transporter
MDDSVPAPQDEVRGVGRRTRSGMKWTTLGTAGANGLRFITYPILNRLLLPEEWGAVADVMTVILFFQTLRDVGLAPALVQKKALAPEQVTAAAGFSLLFGLALGLITFVAAPLVGAYYHADDLVPMTRVLAVMFAFRGISSVPRAMCQRHMRFRAIAIVDLASYAFGTITSVILATRGFGAWSQIIGYLCETGSFTLAFVLLAPTRIRFALAPIRDLFNFGAGSMLADVAVYFANYGDNNVVGRTLGKKPMGMYTRAYELMRFPSTVFTNVAGLVLFSSFSRIRDDRERLGRAFRRGTFATAVLLLPASAGLIVVAPEMIRLLLGSKWSPAVLPFQILSFSMMARTSWKLGGTLARAAGDVYAVAIANVAYGVMIVVGAIIGAHWWGISGVAVAVSGECTIHYLVYSWLGLRRTTMSWRQFAAIHIEALIATAAALALIGAVAHALRDQGAIAPVVVGCAILAGALAVFAVAYVGVQRRQADWVWLWDSVRAQLVKRSARGRRDRG